MQEMLFGSTTSGTGSFMSEHLESFSLQSNPALYTVVITTLWLIVKFKKIIRNVTLL